MILSDSIITEYINKGYLVLKPFSLAYTQPNSYDVHLDKTILVDGDEVTLPYTINKGDFVLGCTQEYIEIPNGLVCQVDGKSTLGRKGLQIHVTAGWIDSGFKGKVTLEMVNFGKSMTLEEGMDIGQFIFMESYDCACLYNGHYQNQSKVTPPYM